MTMGDWQELANKTRALLKSKSLTEASKEIQAGLEKAPNQVKLLTIATDIYRASGDREKSLEYAELLITHHSDNWNGYGRAAQDLITLNRFEEAQRKIQTGLAKIPNQVKLLTIATDIYRASGDREKSLEYAELLITNHPDNWNGYGRAAQDLIALNRLEEAQGQIKAGLEKIPNQVNLLTIATDVYRASGDREKSLEYAELLITHHPDSWNRYGRAARDLIVLKRFEEAQRKIQAGLEKIPNQVNLLTIASDIYRASGDREKSLEYAKLLITHHPDNWNRFGRAAQDLVALKRFEEAQKLIHAGLEMFPNQIALKKYLAYVNSLLGTRIQRISNLQMKDIELNENDLISFSPIPDFFGILQSNRDILSEESKIQKKFIFVAGLPRSGTTALGRMLNISSLIEIYTELYSSYRINGYSETDFIENNILEKLKAHRHAKIDLNIFLKNQHSKVIGDKRPSFQFCAESTFDNIGKDRFKCIFVDRSLIDICRSSHKRSENIEDSWNLERGIEHTILLYNASCRQIVYLHDNRPDVLSTFTFPSYENIFTSTQLALKLINFCGVELTTVESIELNEFIDDSKKYVSKHIDPTSPLEKHIKESISKLMDREAHNKFCTITGNVRDYFSGN